MNIKITRLEIFLGLISFVTSKTETFITECIHFIEQKYSFVIKNILTEKKEIEIRRKLGLFHAKLYSKYNKCHRIKSNFIE